MFSGNGSLNGWSYDDSWSNGTYTGAGSCVYDCDSNMMKVSLDYSGDSSTYGVRQESAVQVGVE